MSAKLQALHRTKVGRTGEDIAASYLSRKGFRILERNFKALYGELDIIAIDRDTLVFVEVKTRMDSSFGTPEEAVTPRKLREVVQTAQYYATLHPKYPQALRVDVIGIVLGSSNEVISLTYTPNASM